MDKLYVRERYLSKLRSYYDSTDMVKILTGVRGSGKSTILELIIDELTKGSVKEENIIKIALDKRPYKGIRSAGELIELLREQIEGVSGIKYVFIDEIHYIPGYETALNVITQNEELSIFITSSNGYILHPKHLGMLNLRYAIFEIFTLNFDEYLEMKELYGIVISENLDEEFNNYLMEGGVAYIVANDIHDATKKYSKDVLNEIFEQDIRHHKRIKNPDEFNAIKSYIINSFGNPVVINDMQEALAKKLGKSVRKETLYNYLGILEDARIVYKCSRFDMNSKRIMKGKEKYYLADLSFYFANDMYNTLALERSLENVIHNYSKSYDYGVAAGKIGRMGVDFILEDIEMDYAYIQVTDYMDDGEVLETGRIEKEDDEYFPLEKIRDFYPKYVLSLDKIIRKRNGIKQRNIVDCLKNCKLF